MILLYLIEFFFGLCLRSCIGFYFRHIHHLYSFKDDCLCRLIAFFLFQQQCLQILLDWAQHVQQCDRVFFSSLIITFIIFISSSLGKESGLLLFLSWNLFLFNVITFSKLCALSLPLAAFAYQHTTLLIVLLLSFPLLSAPRVSVSWSFSLCFIGSNRLDGRLIDCLCSFLIVEVFNLDILYCVSIWTSY